MKFFSSLFIALFALFTIALASPAKTKKCKTTTLPPIPDPTCILNVLPHLPHLGKLDAKKCTVTNHHHTHTVMTDCKNCALSTIGFAPGPIRLCSTTVTTHHPLTVTACAPSVTCK